MKIAILAPSSKDYIRFLLPEINFDDLPMGYTGAPFIGVLITELLSMGHEVIAITTTVSLNHDYKIKEYKTKNFKWVVIPSRKHSIRFNKGRPGRILDFYAFEQNLMIKSIIENQPDFIHAHWSYEFAGAAINSEIPCLVTIHDNAIQVAKYFKNIYRFGRLLMSERILRKVRFSSTVSPYMMSYVKTRCQNVKIIPNPVVINLSSNEVRIKIKRRLKTIKSPKIVMIMNGWNNLKNGRVGFKVFELLSVQFPEATLHLFGHDTEVGGLAYSDRAINSTNRIFFNGFVSNDVLLSQISDAHILLHTSLEESFGVVLIEAMSQGIPAFGGYDSGAVPWVINNPKLLVDIKNPLAITERLVTLLTDEFFYEETAISCYENTLSRFSSDVVVKSYLGYYNEIMHKW